MQLRLYVIIAIFTHNEAVTVSVGRTKEDALKAWRKYMTYDESNLLAADKQRWVNDNECYLREFGKSERQDNGTFYRLNPMIQSV